MADTNQDIVNCWEELKVLVEMIDLDIRKNARGNTSAGIRARKNLRSIKKHAADLVRKTVEEDRRRKKEKKSS